MLINRLSPSNFSDFNWNDELELQKYVLRYEKIIENKDNIQKKNFGAFSKFIFSNALHSLVYTNNRKIILDFLYMSLQFGKAHLEFLSKGEEVSEVTLGKYKVKLKGSKEKFDSYHFKNLMLIAYLFRDESSMVELRSYLGKDLFHIYGEAGQLKLDYQMLRYTAEDKLRRYKLAGLKEIEYQGIAHYIALDPKESGTILMKENAKRFQMFAEPKYDLHELMISQTEREFNEAFKVMFPKYIEAIKSVEDLKDNSNFWIIWDLFLTCCLAHEKGWEIELESDYFPSWLYKREFEIPTDFPT
ncbi:hypothetical protein EI427_25030 [Flammeovirga pectinis]|uniref:Uncharacterized protein n=1 Tax=Flammeovirga pectinis TaxID=2494373 RepID=A0A3Q9FUM6_9BACT|nr:Imm49 family immunity protein [Flammeovirga pectinis]AZQ65479.1 hypothetical protein EI427_25030 [Flammeovirga pectinis]